MPYYNYSCAKCRHEFSALVGSTTENVSCPECAAPKAVRSEICTTTIKPSNRRWGGIRDLSSNSCPCGCASRKRASA